MSTKKEKRITILNDEEIFSLYEKPIFSQAERNEYFAFDDEILSKVENLDKLQTKLYLMLLIGYFRSKPVVPAFELKEVKVDVDYLLETYFKGRKARLTLTSKSTRNNLVNKLFEILDFEKFNKSTHQLEFVNRLKDVAMIDADPRYLFDECLAFFGQKRIALLRYTTIQDHVTETLSVERQRTESILLRKMTDSTKQHLKKILNTKGALNSLTGYKGSARDFSPSELNRELQTHETIKHIYRDLKEVIEELSLSQGNLNHYASIIKHRSIYKVRRFPESQSFLYLACYLYFRYRETNDKLVVAFSYLTRKHSEASKRFAKQRIADELEVIRKKLKYAGNILNYFVDDELSDVTSFGNVREKAFSLISKDEIRMISKHLNENDFDLIEYEWQYTEKNSLKTANMLRRLFIAIDIECDEGQTVLANQINQSKKELSEKKRISTVNLNFIHKPIRPYLKRDGDINIKRFEYYLYYKTYKMLDADKIYITESEENKRLEDDLIPVVDWKNKGEIIRKTGLTRLQSPIADTLKDLGQVLESRMKNVACAIQSGANKFVTRKSQGDQLAWTLANKKWKDDVDNPIYSQVKHMGIIDIMNFVNRKTGYLDAFNNIGTRKHSTKADNNDLNACIFGNGANYGFHKMASASDRKIGDLKTVNDSYIRPETTSKANEIISNGISALPIFKHYTINEVAPFGSVDGQKHACRIKTFKARYSAKYFRKGKGVSAITLVCNHVPLNSTVISPNEYEAHFAFDLLYNNKSDIQPKVLTSDTHGVNSVNFAVLDIFDYQFAPRYAKFKNVFNDQFEIEVGDTVQIQMKTPINENLIISEWDKIQRIICSLSRKTSTQSTIIKKLSNNKRNSRTLAALHEYDRLIKCLYLLDYVDNETLRQFIQNSLCRGESYHQLRRAIASINGNQFRGGNDYQIDQWNDCARVIANCIIYYNSALLSSLLKTFESRGNRKAVDVISNLSPVGWQHIQLSGNYVFDDNKANINFETMLENIDPEEAIEESEAA